MQSSVIARDAAVHQRIGEQLVETILTAVRSALSNVQLVPPSVPVRNSVVTDEDTAAASADIADAFLDSL